MVLERKQASWLKHLGYDKETATHLIRDKFLTNSCTEFNFKTFSWHANPCIRVNSSNRLRLKEMAQKTKVKVLNEETLTVNVLAPSVAMRR